MHSELHQAQIHRAAVIADLQEAREYRAADDKREASLAAYHACADRMVKAVMRGDDETLYRGSYVSITTIGALTECSDTDARQLLLAACKHAMFGADQEASHLLRQFVQSASANFAQHWGDE